MPTFAYTAIDRAGKTLHGRIEALSESALETALKVQGQWLAEAKEVREAVVGSTRRSRSRSLSHRELIEFFQQLSIQMRAGIPILSALAFGAKEPDGSALAAIQRDLFNRVRAGGSLSSALAAHPKAFQPVVVNLVKTGEVSGQLKDICSTISQYYEWLDRLITEVRQALIYPAFILASTVLFVALIFSFVVPRFSVVLRDLHIPLPGLTLAVMRLSEFVLSHALLLSIIAGALAVLVTAGPKYSRRLRAALDRLRLELPVFGRMVQLVCLTRFTQNLAIMYRAGVPLLDSLKLSRGLVGNHVLETAIDEIVDGVNQGRPVHEQMALHSVFPRLVVRMVEVGEATGSLGDSLRSVAEYYNDLLPRQVKKTFAVLEPAIIVVLVGVVGTVALAIFLPIVQMLSLR